MAMIKYDCFRTIMNLVSDYYEVTDADLNNYANEIDVTGRDEFGNTIRIRVEMKHKGGTENGESV